MKCKIYDYSCCSAVDYVGDPYCFNCPYFDYSCEDDECEYDEEDDTDE